MDDLVRQALAKWPDVPDCTGWLALDARGRWRAGDAAVGPRMPITHAAMIAFINRNYFSTGRHWVFQNGPQRVLVELEYTPFVWRLHPRDGGAWDLVAHTGTTMTPSAVWLDDAGRFVIQARAPGGEPTVGVVHDHDTALLAELLRDDHGEPLDDETVGQLAAANDSGTRVRAEPAAPVARLDLPLADATVLRLPVHRIAARNVPVQFGFEPRPSVGLRVDVDTRR